MPYTIRKQKCKQSDGDSGTHVLSYTDKKGKKHRACHTSKKKARGQIAAIEAESVDKSMKLSLNELRNIIRQVLEEEWIAEQDSSNEGDDKDEDGDEDFADVCMARMIAGGMPKKDAYKKSRKYDE